MARATSAPTPQCLVNLAIDDQPRLFSQRHGITASMFKATPSLQKMLRRLPLSPKQAGKEYYKGNRVGSMGIINRYGNFIPDWNKIRTFVYPERGITNTEVCGKSRRIAVHGHLRL